MPVYLFIIVEKFFMDTVEAPKAVQDDDNMPTQITSPVGGMLQEQVRFKVIFIVRPVLYVDLYFVLI